MNETRRPGRPPENREKVTLHLQKETVRKLRTLVDPEDPKKNTLGKVLDSLLKRRLI